jgi:hypothetical protein
MDTIVMLPSEICAANSRPYCRQNVISHYCSAEQRPLKEWSVGGVDMFGGCHRTCKDIERNKSEVDMLL